jgi:ATPase subunit of ABC transporter with duplicated ATPase domains
LKLNIEETLAMCKSSALQLEEQNTSLKQDNKKANSIIQHFQSKYQSTKAELKLSESYKLKKEQTINEKEQHLDREQQVNAMLKQQLQEKDEKLLELQAVNKKQEEVINDNKEALMKNENMIRYLNKVNINKARFLTFQEMITISSPHTIDNTTPSAYQFRTSFKTMNPSLLKTTDISKSQLTSSLPLPTVSYNPIKY